MHHSYASGQLTNGTNPWYVAQQLGHVDVPMVFRIYGKFSPADYRTPTLALKVVANNRFHMKISVRNSCESNANERQYPEG